MTQPGLYLKQILDKAAQATSRNSPCLAVFDLDSTLFDVSPRLKMILHNFATEPKHQKQFPAACELLLKAEMARTDWGIEKALLRVGLTNESHEFHSTLRKFWMDSFFSNEYLHYDKPYEGAPEFVNELYKLNCEIVYLTGRDVARMERGSREVLMKWNLPLDEVKSKLVLKPQQGLDDAQFKSSWFSEVKEKFEKIWFFENEPANVNLVRNQHPEVEIVFFDSTHSGKAVPPIDLPRIFNFLFDQESRQ